MATTKPSTDFPISYADPRYVAAEASSAQRNGVPTNLVAAIRETGERSNANQVSEKGARTPYQITPATRKAAIEKYGIDPWLSPENAAEVSTLLLKESLKRNDGNPVAAAGEYHGGTDRANWGPRTKMYMARIAKSLDAKRIDDISAGFDAYLAQQKAAQAAKSSPASTPKGDELAAGFGEFLAQQKEATQAPREASTLDKAVGTGEAAIGAIGGGTADLIGQAGGLIGSGIARGVQGVQDALSGDSTLSSTDAANIQGQVATQAGSNLAAPFMPSSAEGQRQLQAVGDAADMLTPALPLTAELGAISGGASDAAAAARAGALGSAGKLVDAVKAPARRATDAVLNTINPDRAAEQVGGVDSAGAMRASDAAVRQTRAANLPVPIEDLTVGQATRDFGQQQFERESAKNAELGGDIRTRMADHNEKLLQNLDAVIDETGATAADAREVGEAVDAPLRARMARDKIKIRDAYKAAEAAGELEAPVTFTTLADHLNGVNAESKLAGSNLDAIRTKAIDTGLLAEDDNGVLTAQPTTLRQGEIFRRSLRGLTNDDPTNVRNAAQIRSLYDDATDSVGGTLYKRARGLRVRLAKDYENNRLVRSLLGTVRGSDDRAVALEDVVNKSVMADATSLDSLRHLGKLLKTEGRAGQQAWKEIQGEVLRQIRDAATKDVARDERGNKIVNAGALDRSINKLDRGRKLDYLFGKKGAQTLRDINDVAKDVITSVPGSVNHSNTASIVAAMFDLVVSSHTGVPAPVASAIRLMVKHAKDNKVKVRIHKALNDAKIQKAP